MAIFFAVCCLVFSSFNDLLLKFYTRKPRSRGMLFLIIGIVGTCVAAVSFNYTSEHWQTTLLWGGLCTLFWLIANILLIEAMERLPAGVCATVYHLNLVPTVLAAWLLLGEKISLLHWLGILFALGAIFCFFNKDKSASQTETAQMVKTGMKLVFMAGILRAAAGISQKYGLTCGADRNGIVLLNIIGWAVGGVFYGLLREKHHFKLDRTTAGYGILAGIFVLGIVFFTAAAQKAGDAGVVLPISQMSFPFTFLLSIFLIKEKFTLIKGIGVLLAAAAILLLCL